MLSFKSPTFAMHNSMMGSSGMDQESHPAHDNSYANEQWVDINPYNQMGISGYGGEYYAQGLPSESLSRHMPPPPLPQQMQQHQAQPAHYANHMPHSLIIPTQQPSQVAWPSLQTNPIQSYSAPPVAIPPVSAHIKPAGKLTSSTTSQPRRTLTDEDRRNMCKYHEENPHVKQTEIGQKFGVERSTVSKVLRQKEKYLYSEDRSGSPVKRAKGKFPDIERALANWVRREQKKGVVVSDADMEAKAKVFATTTAGGSESPLKLITSSWLEKFKQKHGIGPGKLIRRASETAIPDSAVSLDSPSLSASQTPGGISPASASGQTSPPIPSSATTEDGKDNASNFMDFDGSGYKHPHAQSTTSLSSAITDPASSTFSGSAFSPTSQFTFSPDPNSGIFGDHRIPPGSSNFQRPRSQTFPTLEIEYLNTSQTTEPSTPKYSASGTAPSSALESPAHEIPAPTFNLDTTVSPQLHHSSSNSSMRGRANNAGGLLGSMPSGSTASSPTQEDARKAADTLISFMQQSGLIDQNEYATILRLTEKLRLHQQQQQQPQQHQNAKSIVSNQVLGGLSRIPESDTEMPSIPTEVIKPETLMSD